MNQHGNVLFASIVTKEFLSKSVITKWISGEKLKHHLLLLVDGGRARLERESEYAILFSGSCWLLLPDERVSIVVDEDKGFEGRAVIFDVWRVSSTGKVGTEGTSEEAVMRTAKFPVSGMLDNHLADEMRRFIEECERTEDATKEVQAFSQSVRFMDMLLKIWRAGGEQSKSREAIETIQRTIAVMEQSYARPITRNELAKLANMSPSHYSFVFKRETGQSPMEKLMEIRIHHAKKQLLFSERKLRDIAASVGYGNEFYFSRQFKRLTGVSPHVFASQHFARHVTVSHPFPLHLQSLGLQSYLPNERRDTVNVVGLYVEDFLISLGVKPILKCVGNNFRQSYLNTYMRGAEEWSLCSFDFRAIAKARPDLIILGHPEFGENERFAEFSEIAPTYSIRKGLQNWEEGIRIIGQLLNRLPQAESVIAHREQQLEKARMDLEAVSSQTVELVRICNDRHIRLYGGPSGYSGAVLYRDLGLKPSVSVLQRAWDKSCGFVTMAPDDLYESQADHLFVVVDPAGRHYWNKLVKDSRWHSLPSVRAGCCYEVHYDFWMTFGIIAHWLKVQDVLRLLAPAKLG